MKLKIHIISFFLVCFAGVTIGQNSLYTKNLSESSNRLMGKLTGEIYKLKPIDGTYFFYHDNWYKGSIVLKDGDVFSDMHLRYKSYDDNLIAYNQTNSTLFIVDKSLVEKFYIDSDKLAQTFVCLFYDGLYGENHYFQELYDGTRALLVYHFVNEIKTTPYKNQFGKLADIKYEKDKDFYLYSETTGFKKIRLKRRSIYHTFPEHKKEIKKILKKKGINPKNEWALIEAIRELDKAGILD